MASKSKKSTKPKQTKKTTKSKRATKSSNTNDFLVTEVVIWVSLAISLFLLISNMGFGGSLGEDASIFMYNSFGALAFLFPFLLFGIIAFIISNLHNNKAYSKSVAVLALFAFICEFFELVFDNGGNLGGFFCNSMKPIIGTAGTFLVIVICIVICMVIITGKSAISGVKKQSNRTYERMKEDGTRRKEAYQRRAEQRRVDAQVKRTSADNQERDSKKRKDHRVGGVSFDTTIRKATPDAADNSTSVEDIVIKRGTQAAVPAEVADPFESEPKPKQPRKRTTRKKSIVTAEDTLVATQEVEQQVQEDQVPSAPHYRFPSLNLLNKGGNNTTDSDTHLRETANKLQETLHNFGVDVTITNVSCGPSVTRYELQPQQGVKVSKIVGLADDIKLNLSAEDIRIEAPIPGKAAVGIEVPNKENATVMLRDLLESKEFQRSESKISFATGKDIAGNAVVSDIAKMPHVLIAGATGSGKSVCINTLIMSILYKARPDEVKLIMVDPKVVELSVYNGIPHLMIPVVTDPKKAAGALNWAVAEMTRRYQLFATNQVRDMKGYNEKVEAMEPDENGSKPDKMPQIVIIVDELADLMMVAKGEVEEAICRLAQLARAAGIHLVLATQRPSVNVITGLIKANMPSRIAFAVSSGIDSRTIIDMNGAEKLLGKGDMLFYPSRYPKPARVQGAFVSDAEVQRVVDFLKETNQDTEYDQDMVDTMVNSAPSSPSFDSDQGPSNDRDAYFAEAGKFIVEKEKASIGMLQRVFKIGFNRAARIMDQLCEAGVVGPEEGTKPRKVLMTLEEYEQFLNENQ